MSTRSISILCLVGSISIAYAGGGALEVVLRKPVKELRIPEVRADMLRLLADQPTWQESTRQNFEQDLLEAKAPSAVIRIMNRCGGLRRLLPEVWGLIGVPQDKRWHPEGDVFNHTMLVLDAAAEEWCQDRRERLMLLYGAIAHDLGKKVTTRYFPANRDRAPGEKIEWGIGSLGHEQEGESIARVMMRRLGVDQGMVEAVAKLARWHMEHGRLKRCSRPETIQQKFKQIHEDIEGRVPFATLLKLMAADMRGCTNTGRPLPRQVFDLVEEFKAHAKDQGLYDGPMHALACSYAQEYAEESDDETHDPTYRPVRKKRRGENLSAAEAFDIVVELTAPEVSEQADSPKMTDIQLST